MIASFQAGKALPSSSGSPGWVLTEERKDECLTKAPARGTSGAGQWDWTTLGWSHSGLVPVLQPPKGSSSHQGEHPELSLVPEQGWASWRGLEEPWGWAKCERSSRAPSTAHVPSSLARLWGHTGWVGAQADCQSQPAGGSSARPCSRHCTQASKRNTGKDN